jgi:arylsulfatase A-like enzyme
MKTTLALTLFCSLLLLPILSSASDQPNFLFLLSDDQAWNGLSCQMHPDMPDSRSQYIETPNIARLAEEGMRFSAGYSPASVCAPTRISLQTGKSPAQCHWTKAAGSLTAEDGFPLIPPQNRRSIDAAETTIGELLQSAGYTTAHFGKWHISGGGPEQHGYDESDGDTGNQDAEPHLPPNPVDIFGMGERAMALMAKSKQTGKPFFIQMSYHALHYPQNAPPELVEKYAGLMPKGNEKEIGRAAMSEALDQGIGQLLEKIEALGIADRTYVIYLSDNGSSTKQALRGGKGGVWEGGVRVPLILRGPGISPNSWSHQRVVGYDFYPTLCELAGVKEALPETIEGGSITHLFRGEETPVKRPREELVFHFPHYQGDTPHSALLLDYWKIMHFYETGETHLFDLDSDIAERHDLAKENPEVTGALKEKLFAYLAEVDAQMPEKNPQYDPKNPPSLKENRGEKKGGGKRGMEKKKKGGGKKKRMETDPDSEDTDPSDDQPSDAPAPATKPMADKKPESRGSPPSSEPVLTITGVDVSPAAFAKAAKVGPASHRSSPGPDPGPTWIRDHLADLDINGDGQLVEAELMDQARMAFGAFDSDGDGLLSEREHENRSPKMAVAGFLTTHADVIDSNGDTRITAREFADELREAFRQVDHDQDGAVSTRDATSR